MFVTVAGVDDVILAKVLGVDDGAKDEAAQEGTVASEELASEAV